MFFEAGRIAAGDTHWARVDGDFRPVGETEFARDATFGYTASDLRAFLAERSGGALRAEDVHSVGLDDIRTGGPDRVAELLAPVRDGAWVVVNATEYADLDVVALGLQAARERGQVFLHRCGPSWMQVLAGLDAAPPLARDRIAAAAKGKRGLVVVGSHVAQTSRQVERAVELADLAVVELDARRLVDPADAAREDYLAEVTRAAAAALAEQDVLLMTSRELVRAEDPADSLRIANRVSDGLSTVVSRIRDRGLGWVVTKGGITSHEIAATGLGIRRARVEGQLFPGTVSMMRPLVAPPEVVGLPWVVFAGDVGDTDTLARVVTTMAGIGRMSALRVGWVGLGAMGAPMAACAARAGFDVVAYDVDGERRAALTREGAAAATSAAEAAKGADVLAVMVATPEQVEDVLFGAAAAADALRPGAVVLVMATVGPDAAADCAARLSERGVDLVDAPVSGGVARAATGDLLVLAAGNAAVLSRVRPLLDALAATVSVVGDDVGCRPEGQAGQPAARGRAHRGGSGGAGVRGRDGPGRAGVLGGGAARRGGVVHARRPRRADARRVLRRRAAARWTSSSRTWVLSRTRHGTRGPPCRSPPRPTSSTCAGTGPGWAGWTTHR